MANTTLSLPKRQFLKSARRIPISIWLCLIWIAVVVFVDITAQWLAPFDYLQQSPLARFAPPGAPGHLLGTDYLGRDVLSNILVATQTSLMIALVGSLICAFIGTTLGFLAAHFGGWVDNLIMGFADAKASVPFIIFALGVLAFLGSSPLILLMLVGVASFERYARLTRKNKYPLCVLDFVLYMARFPSATTRKCYGGASSDLSVFYGGSYVARQ